MFWSQMREDGTFVADSGAEVGHGAGAGGGGLGGPEGGKLSVMADLRRQLNAEREENRVLRDKVARVKESDSLLKVRVPLCSFHDVPAGSVRCCVL
jgi:hypothetical protein